MSRALLSGVLLVCTLAGCIRSAGPSENSKALQSSETLKTARHRQVNLAIWAAYISADALAEFTKKTGIEVNVSNYPSNEDLFTKLQAGASGIDVCVPSDHMVEIMIKTGLLQPLDLPTIPNRTGLDRAFLKQAYDVENKYSLPYAWSTAGLAINTALFKGTLKGWKDLFRNNELSGKISLLDDAREVIGAALKANGYSANSTDEKALESAKMTLKDFRKRIKMYRSDSIDPLINKEVAVAHAFSSDALKAAEKTNGQIVFILPEEGGTRSIDNLVIPKSAKNVAEAHELINFLLSKEVNISFVKSVFGGPVLAATRENLPMPLRTNSALFPSTKKMRKLESLRDVGITTRIYDQIWTEIKAD